MWDAPWHWVILAAVVIALFGYKRLPDASRALGRSLRIFKTEVKGMAGDDAARDAAQAQPVTDAAAPAATPKSIAPSTVASPSAVAPAAPSAPDPSNSPAGSTPAQQPTTPGTV